MYDQKNNLSFKLRKKNLFLLFFWLLSIAIVIFFGSEIPRISSTVAGCGLILLGLKTKKPVVVLYSVFASSYFFYLSPFFLFDIPFATRENYLDYETSVINMQCLILFSLTFFIFLEVPSEEYIDLPNKLERKNNFPIFMFCISAIIFLGSLMVTMKGTAYGVDYREVTEARYAFIDYSIIFLFLSFMFSDKKYNFIILMAGATYIFICLIYGYRLRMIQMGLIVFFLFFEKKINTKILFILLVFIFFGLKLVASMRGLDKAIDFQSLLGISGGVTISNQGGVFLNANMYIGLVNDGFITIQQRISTFFGNIVAIFYSQSALPASLNLSKLASQYFSIPGGGLISGYIYVWAGLYSSIPVGLFIAYLYSKLLLNKRPSVYYVAYMVVIISVFPRWFAYSPIHFFKMSFYCVFLLFVFNLFDRFLRQVKKVEI